MSITGMPMQYLLNRAFETNNNDAVVGLSKLFVERFKLVYHSEVRTLAAYALVAVKPKMKKADPASRSFCKFPNAPAGSPPGSRVITCQNTTMAQFVDNMEILSPAFNWPVLDATELEGGWDVTQTSTCTFPRMMGGPGKVGDAGSAPTAQFTCASNFYLSLR